MAHRIRRQLSVIVFLALAGAIGGASAGHAQTLPPSCTGFTDDPLQAGVTVKAQHLTELRACVDALRVQAGLAAVTWTDLTLQAGATWIRAVHIIELRTALGAVYAAHGETEPAYTDPALTAVATLVRAAHITEIRTAILVVAGVCEPETCSNDGPIDQAIEYYHLDALGSVRAVTDEVGDVVRRHDYFPFGEGVSAIDGYVQRYAEQEGDPESGLSYVGARYYRAWTGRFTTVDPGHVGGDLFNPQSRNGYAYAHNNPLALVDPTGTNAAAPWPGFCSAENSFGRCGGNELFWAEAELGGGGGGGGFGFGDGYAEALAIGYTPGMSADVFAGLMEWDQRATAALDNARTSVGTQETLELPSHLVYSVSEGTLVANIKGEALKLSGVQSGKGACLNNAACERQSGRGPIPGRVCQLVEKSECDIRRLTSTVYAATAAAVTRGISCQPSILRVLM